MKKLLVKVAISCSLFLIAVSPTLGQCSTSGTWNTNWGDMTLDQSGSTVTGTYTHDSGKINGTVSGSKLTGKWSESPSYSEPNDSGDVELEFNGDCSSFTGNWKYGSSGDWSGSWTGTKLAGESASTNQTGEATQVFDSTDRYLGACGYTDTTSWTQSEDMNITILQIWYSWESGETEVPFTFKKDGQEIASGVFAKTEECQWTWCNGNYNINKVFTKGSKYDLKLTKSKQCKDNQGRGAVRLYGWKGSGSGATVPSSSALSTGVYRTCTGATASLTLETRTVAKGRQVEIPLKACNVQDLTNMDFTLKYDPTVLTFVEANKGSLNANSLFESNETSKGNIKISFASTTSVTGSGTLAIFTFDVIGSVGSSSNLTGTVPSAKNSSGNKVSTSITGGKFTVGNTVAGDCDGDSLVTSRDALAALQMSVGKIEVDLCYDINSDGKVDSSDAREILKKAVGGN